MVLSSRPFCRLVSLFSLVRLVLLERFRLSLTRLVSSRIGLSSLPLVRCLFPTGLRTGSLLRLVYYLPLVHPTQSL